MMQQVLSYPHMQSA